MPLFVQPFRMKKYHLVSLFPLLDSKNIALLRLHKPISIIIEMYFEVISRYIIKNTIIIYLSSYGKITLWHLYQLNYSVLFCINHPI